jgi:hypothetical protein
LLTAFHIGHDRHALEDAVGKVPQELVERMRKVAMERHMVDDRSILGIASSRLLPNDVKLKHLSFLSREALVMVGDKWKALRSLDCSHTR